MLRVPDASNFNQVLQKRLIRPVYGHTQATPYAATLDPSLRNTDGSFRKPLSTDTNPLTRSADAFTLLNGLVPGTVMVKGAGETAVVATGANSALVPFGLLGQFVGGTLDELGSNNEIAVWRGPDAVIDLLAPAFNPTGLSSAYSSAGAGNPVLLYAGADGRLTSSSPGGSAIVVAHLIDFSNPNVIRIDLKI